MTHSMVKARQKPIFQDDELIHSVSVYEAQIHYWENFTLCEFLVDGSIGCNKEILSIRKKSFPNIVFASQKDTCGP